LIISRLGLLHESRLVRPKPCRVHYSLANPCKVSNICDTPYLGLAATVDIFTPLLQRHTTNPHATLITLFMNAIEEEFEHCGDAENTQIVVQELTRIAKYLPYRPNLDRYDPYSVKMLFATPLVRDADRYLEK
jgi:hypothetical protein